MNGKNECKEQNTESFTAIVNYYETTIIEMFQEANFDKLHSKITPKEYGGVPKLGKFKVVYCFVDLAKKRNIFGVIYEEDAKKKIISSELWLPDICEMLVFAKEFPNEQRKKKIIILSYKFIFDNAPHFLCLRGDKDSRVLDWYEAKEGFDKDCYFLVIRSRRQLKTKLDDYAHIQI